MNRKNLPLIIMLTAAAVTSIITFIREYSMLAKLVSLFVVMLVFYILGSILKWTLDYFDEQNEKRRLEEGDVIEKDIEGEIADQEQIIEETEAQEPEES